jgi:hypothetical protein
LIGPTLIKAKNKRGSIFNCSFFIEVFRELSKHTPYMLWKGFVNLAKISDIAPENDCIPHRNEALFFTA